MSLSKLFVLFCLAAAMSAQPVPPAFEVATIKPAPLGGAGYRAQRNGPGRMLFQMNLRDLVYWAYGSGLSTSVRVTGGPDWVNRDRYDIQAQAQGQPSERQFREMLRNLLAERFALKVRKETQSIDVYALLQARSDGKLGPKVTEWNGACEGGSLSPDDDPTTPRCMALYRLPGLFLDGVTMFAVAEMLSLPMARNLTGRVVQDRTGLKGRYKMELEFPFGPARPVDPSAPPGSPAPSLFTVLQEQWGLKLEPVKGPLEVIVIESAEPPTEN